MIGAVDVGEMVSLTASALAAPALGYTTLLRGKRASHEVLATLVPLFFAASCFPWALHYQSRLCERAATPFASCVHSLSDGLALHRRLHDGGIDLQRTRLRCRAPPPLLVHR